MLKRTAKIVGGCEFGKYTRSTCTIKELVEGLGKYPQDTPVMGVWDDFPAPISRIKIDDGYYDGTEIMCLDVDSHF